MLNNNSNFHQVNQPQQLKSLPQQFELRLIQNYQQILPFRINQINNLIQLTYTCFVDLKDGKKYLEIQTLGGYRKLKLRTKRNSKNGGYQFGEMTKQQEQINRENKSFEKFQRDKHQNEGQLRRQMDLQDIQVVVLIIAVEGLDDRMEKQEKGNDLNQQGQAQFMNKNKDVVEQKRNRPLLHVPYNIYNHLAKAIKTQKSFNCVLHKPSVTIHRFPISLTNNLRITSSHQTLEKIKIKNFIPPYLGNQNINNVKLLNQWKDLIVKILINPKYHQERKKLLNSTQSKENQKGKEESSVLGEYEFYVFLCREKEDDNRDNISNIKNTASQRGSIKTIHYQIDVSLLGQKNNQENSSIIKNNSKAISNNSASQKFSTASTANYKHQSLKNQQYLLRLIKQNNQINYNTQKSSLLKNITKNYIQFQVQFEVGNDYERYCEGIRRIKNNKNYEQIEQEDYHSPYIVRFLPGKTLIEFEQIAGNKQNQNQEKQVNSGGIQRSKGNYSKVMIDKNRKSLFLDRIIVSKLYKEIFFIPEGVYESILEKFQTMFSKGQLERIIKIQQDNENKINKKIDSLQLFSLQSDYFICLKTDNHIGIQTYFHYLSQQNFNRKFVQIDCQNFVTRKQFFKYLKNITIVEGQNIFILIKNIGWLEGLSKIQDISPEPIKSIIENVYNSIKDSYRSTLVNFMTVVYFAQDSLPQELPHMTNRLEFYLKKQTKIDILKMIFQQISLANKIVLKASIQQTITNMLINSYGWERILQFLRQLSSGDEEKQNIFNKPEKQIIKLIQKQFSLQNIENVAQVSWDDIGGLQTAKQQIIQTVLLPTKHPEIFDEWIRPRTGLLFYGPPGTGKTLLGKCIAKQCKMSFISVKGPELLNMYVGESQKNVRQIFQRAKQSKPCIVFMDQLDALVPKRGNSSDSNAVMDRIVAQLLTQMDTASQNGIFIIGATNRPDLLDPSILRTGRFDKQIYLGISKNHEDRVKILKAQTRNSRHNSDFNYDQIIKKVPINFTGADFYGLTSKAMMKAVQRCINIYQKGQQTNPQVIITQNDFQQVIPSIKPSVSQQQLKHYQSLKQKFS